MLEPTLLKFESPLHIAQSLIQSSAFSCFLGETSNPSMLWPRIQLLNLEQRLVISGPPGSLASKVRVPLKSLANGQGRFILEARVSNLSQSSSRVESWRKPIHLSNILIRAFCHGLQSMCSSATISRILGDIGSSSSGGSSSSETSPPPSASQIGFSRVSKCRFGLLHCRMSLHEVGLPSLSKPALNGAVLGTLGDPIGDLAADLFIFFVDRGR
ncbi:hypothetical protein Cgig2_023872 [Carnegiea gigantea]|uniref:Uncharacterized protein n=1 Tax=Carnegiea gigantea TaxID=171969 RepID=A0A9Q1JEV7_9CARY|nr:hypothetical protein Cgig2_023872 [Carnegiea gigantea]